MNFKEVTSVRSYRTLPVRYPYEPRLLIITQPGFIITHPWRETLLRHLYFSILANRLS